MKLLKTSLLALTLFSASYALAHTDAFLDTQKSPHDGQVRMTDTYHLELVAKDKELTVYVMDHANSPINSAGMTGTATVLAGGNKVDLKLEPTQDNILKGTGDFKTDNAMKVVVTITPAPQTARFTPFQKATDAATPSSTAPSKEDKDPHAGHDMSKMPAK